MGDTSSVSDSSSTPSPAANGHEMRTVPLTRSICNFGPDGVSTTPMMLQKPPATEYCPPLTTPASAWPMVLLTEYTPPVLVLPPPAIVNQSMLRDWAWADVRAVQPASTPRIVG